MSNKSIKMKGYILILGIFMFALLAISTIVRSELVEDYIHFQVFRNQLNVNSFIIKKSAKYDSLNRNSEVIDLIQELDLTMYLLKDSVSINIYRGFNKNFDYTMGEMEDNWTHLTDFFFHNGSGESTIMGSTITNILKEVERSHRMLRTLERTTRVWYIVILTINLVIFVVLLVFVYYLTNIKERSNSIGVMSVRNALIQGQEQERLRISLELHDKVAQDLFASKMIINDLYSSITEDDMRKSFSKSLNLLDTSIKEVRDLSYSLRPPALQAIGLDSAIQSYIDNFSKKVELPISFKAVGVANKKLDETVSINLYRILQETLNNSAKHAHAENMDVKLIFSYPFLLLKIEDDGVGFNYVKSEMKVKGREKLGLPGINERVSLLGGELIINSSKGEGTKILIKVPVESNEKM